MNPSMQQQEIMRRLQEEQRRQQQMFEWNEQREKEEKERREKKWQMPKSLPKVKLSPIIKKEQNFHIAPSVKEESKWKWRIF